MKLPIFRCIVKFLSMSLLLLTITCAFAADPLVEQARELESTNPEKAADLYEKYVKKNALAEDASEAKYREGLMREETGDYYRAYQIYQHIVDNYPLFTDMDELLDRQYRIGNYFLLLSSRDVAGIPWPGGDKEKAVEIFKQVVKNAPFSETGIKAQYRLGYTLVQIKEYSDAIDELRIMLEKYPDSGFTDDTVYLLAKAYFALAQGPEYDQYAIEKSLEYYTRYVNEFPQGRYVNEAIENIPKLNQQLAEKIYLIGEFYEKQNFYEASLIYYDDLHKKYPDTFFAEKARDKRQKLETIVKLEVPFKEVQKNYNDIAGIYSRLKRKDTRQPWEFWRSDPLTPEQREQFEWSEALLKVAREHVKEAREIYEFERESTLTEIEIRDLKKDTQRLRNQLIVENELLAELQAGAPAAEDIIKDELPPSDELPKNDLVIDYVPHFILYWMRYEPYMKTRTDIGTLIKDKKADIHSINRKIDANTKRLEKLNQRLQVEKQALAANQAALTARREELLGKAELLRHEIDALIRGDEEIEIVEIDEIELASKKRKWDKKTKDMPPSTTEKTAPSSEQEKRPEILDQLSQEAAEQQGVFIPYEERLKPNWWQYWNNLLIGPQDRIRTPDDAKPLMLK